MNQKLSKFNQPSGLVEHTITHWKFIFYISQGYFIFMDDISCKFAWRIKLWNKTN